MKSMPPTPCCCCCCCITERLLEQLYCRLTKNKLLRGLHLTISDVECEVLQKPLSPVSVSVSNMEHKGYHNCGHRIKHQSVLAYHFETLLL